MKRFLSNLRKLWEYAKYEKKNMSIYFIFIILGSVLSVIVPIYTARRIVYLTDNNFIQLFIVSLVILGLNVSRNIIYTVTGNFNQKIYRNILVRLQVKMGEEVLKLTNKTFIENGSGVFNQRINNDTTRLSDLFPLLLEITMNIITDIGIFVMIFIINKIIFIFMIFMMTIIYLLDNKRSDVRTKKMNEKRKIEEKVSTFSAELCRGSKDIKTLSSEDSFISEFRRRIREVNDKSMIMMNTDRMYRLGLSSFQDLYEFLLIVLYIYLISNNELTVALALVINNYKFQANSLIHSITWFLDYTKEFNLSCDRVFGIIDGGEFEKEKFGDKEIKDINGNIKFKNVKFNYNKAKVIKDLSFEVSSGKTVAFVGKSGSGKTTIFNLLCKLYDVKDDMIFIDGYDINDLSKESIRDNITIIPQDPYIFNMTIRENFELIKKNTTLKEIKEVCKMACLDDYIESLPDKYNSKLGEGGINLSGGQKQRLAIARALLKKTKIILLDEATSALDNKTQEQIQETIRNLKGDYTILIVAHRLSTIIDSDEIFVIDDGKVVDSGTHKELLKNSLIYKNLYNKDLNN